MSKFKNSWRVFHECCNVLCTHKNLVIFPIVSSLVMLVVTASFILPIFFLPELRESLEGFQNGSQFSTEQIPALIGLLIFYIVSAFVVVFFNVALSSAVQKYFAGEETGFGIGMSAAKKKTGQIFVYAVVAGTVGFLLKILQDKLGSIAGKIVVGLLGAGWSIATFFVIPVLAAEKLGLIDTIKSSGSTFKKTWGESVIGSVGLGIAGFLTFFLVIIAAGILVAFAVTSGSLAVIVTAIVVAVAALVVTSVVFSTLGQIYRTVLFLFARDGKTVPGFDPILVEEAFQPKKK